jgi:hypothetical protein
MNGREVYFSPPEEEIIDSLQEIYGITYLEACEQVIMQKRELAFMHQRRGELALAEVLLKQLGEWNDAIEEEFKQRKTYSNKKEIILLS